MLPHIKQLEVHFGDLLVRVDCECAACREIQLQALPAAVGSNMPLKKLAPGMEEIAEVSAVELMSP